jgi:hypothetical protein
MTGWRKGVVWVGSVKLFTYGDRLPVMAKLFAKILRHGVLQHRNLYMLFLLAKNMIYHKLAFSQHRLFDSSFGWDH